MIYDINKIRLDFPMINNEIIYLDNASSTYKPLSVINEISNFYKYRYSLPNKGLYNTSIDAYKEIEDIRNYISKFINSNYNEIIFTKGSTEGINLIANSLPKYILNNGDNIIISSMEHHANILPWQKLFKERNISIKIIPIIKSNGFLCIKEIDKLIDKKTKIISITHVSNVLGTNNPVKEIIKLIRSINKNIIIIIDGSQSIMHLKIDVKDIDCDFYLFSGHKLYGPLGIGILYGKSNLLKCMIPWEVGGSIVKYVCFNKQPIYIDSPWKFETGSINISSIIGLKYAIKYILNLNIENIINWESKIMNYTLYLLKKEIPNIIIYGSLYNKIGIISFNIKNIDSNDIGFILNKYKIAIRVGHHCSIPLMKIYNVNSMCRVSFALYTNYNDIEIFVEKLKYSIKLLS